MSTLNARQQFIKNCFGEIREQISLGITTEQSKRDPNTQEWLPNDYSQRRARLFDTVKKELDSSKKLFVPSWNLKNVDEKDVFDAIVIFYLICDCYGKEDKAIEEALNHFVDIAAYRKFPPSLQNVGAQAKTHQVIKSILAAFGDIEENEEGEVKEDDKMASLIWKYFGYFPYATDEFGNPIKNKKTEKYVSVDVAHSAQLLHFNRHIRNAMAHKNKEFEPKYRQEIAVQFLYNYIIVVYMLKFYLKREFSTKFADYYERYKKDYNIPVYIKNVEKPTTLNSKVGKIAVKEAGQYKLSPFTAYSFEGFAATFDLNEYCYNATITPPSETDYDTIIDLPQEGVNDGLKKELEDIKKAIEDNLKKGERDAARKIVGEKLAQIEGLTLVCNAIKDDVEGLKEQQTEVKNDLKTLLDSSKTLDEICSKIDEFCNSTPYKNLGNALGNLSKGITEVKEDVKKLDATATTILTNQETENKRRVEEEKKKRKRELIRRTILGCVIVLAVAFVVAYFFRANLARPFYDKYHWEKCCEWIYDDGDPDIAYDYAQFQEGNKNFPQAAEWYRKAIERYKEIVESDASMEDFSRRAPSVTEAYFRLAWMYCQAKGGLFDKEQAIQYVSKIKNTEKGIGLYAMLVEDIKEAGEQIVYLKEYKKDDYMLLAEAVWQLADLEPGQCQTDSCYAEAVKTLEQLIAKENSPVRGEALSQYGQFLMYGYGPRGNVKYGLYEGMENLKKAALKENHINSQVELARKYSKMGLFDDSKRFYELALSNGAYQILNEMITMAKFADYSESYLDSLNDVMQNLRLDNVAEFLNKSFLLAKDGLYEKAAIKMDSVLTKANQNSRYFIDDAFYKQQMVLKLKANVDLDQIVSDTVLVKCPQEKKAAYANYLLGIKYAQGYGVEEDQAKSDSLIQLAAKDSITDAIYTWGNLLYYRYGNTLASIAELKKIEDKDDRALELLSQIYKSIDKRISEEYLEKITNDTRLYKVVDEYGVRIQRIADKPDSSLEDYEKCIRVLEGYLCRNNFSDLELSTWIAGYLAYLYLCMDANDDKIRFYARISTGGDGYQYLQYLSDMWLVRGEEQKAKDIYEQYSLIFFDIENGTSDFRRAFWGAQVVDNMRKRFPGMVERVSKELGKDITKDLVPNNNVNSTIIYIFKEYKFPYYSF